MLMKLWTNLLVLLGAISEHDSLGLHVSVDDALQGRHLTLDDVLHLLRQLRLHLLLEATQQEGAQHLV